MPLNPLPYGMRTRKEERDGEVVEVQEWIPGYEPYSRETLSGYVSAKRTGEVPADLDANRLMTMAENWPGMVLEYASEFEAYAPDAMKRAREREEELQKEAEKATPLTEEQEAATAEEKRARTEAEAPRPRTVQQEAEARRYAKTAPRPATAMEIEAEARRQTKAQTPVQRTFIQPSGPPSGTTQEDWDQKVAQVRADPTTLYNQPLEVWQAYGIQPNMNDYEQDRVAVSVLRAGPRGVTPTPQLQSQPQPQAPLAAEPIQPTQTTPGQSVIGPAQIPIEQAPRIPPPPTVPSEVRRGQVGAAIGAGFTAAGVPGAAAAAVGVGTAIAGERAAGQEIREGVRAGRFDISPVAVGTTQEEAQRNLRQTGLSPTENGMGLVHDSGKWYYYYLPAQKETPETTQDRERDERLADLGAEYELRKQEVSESVALVTRNWKRDESELDYAIRKERDPEARKAYDTALRSSRRQYVESLIRLRTELSSYADAKDKLRQQIITNYMYQREVTERQIYGNEAWFEKEKVRQQNAMTRLDERARASGLRSFEMAGLQAKMGLLRGEVTRLRKQWEGAPADERATILRDMNDAEAHLNALTIRPPVHLGGERKESPPETGDLTNYRGAYQWMIDNPKATAEERARMVMRKLSLSDSGTAGLIANGMFGRIQEVEKVDGVRVLGILGADGKTVEDYLFNVQGQPSRDTLRRLMAKYGSR